MFLELLDQAIKIGIAGAEASREPVLAALGNHLAVREHLGTGLQTGRYSGTRTQRLPPIATIAADSEGSSQFILGLDAMR